MTTIPRLESMLTDDLGLFCIANPEEHHVVCPVTVRGRSFIVLVTLQEEGSFLQLIARIDMPEGAARSHAIVDELCTINRENRWVKVAPDFNDRHVIGMGDHWLLDAELDVRHFGHLFHSFIDIIAEAADRLAAVLGIDSSEASRLEHGPSDDPSPIES